MLVILAGEEYHYVGGTGAYVSEGLMELFALGHCGRLAVIFVCRRIRKLRVRLVSLVISVIWQDAVFAGVPDKHTAC